MSQVHWSSPDSFGHVQATYLLWPSVSDICNGSFESIDFHLVLMVCFQVFSPSLSLIPFLMLSLQVLHVFFTVASFFLTPNSIALESTLEWIKLSDYNIPNKKYCSLQKKNVWKTFKTCLWATTFNFKKWLVKL